MKLIIEYLILVTVGLCITMCNPNTNKTTGIYVYTFEKTASITTDNSRQMIADYLGIKNIHDLTVSKDENIAYFVADEDVNTTFEQDLNNGNFAFSKLTNSYLMKMVPTLPSKAEAMKIAENFMKSKSIAPRNGSEIRLVHFGGLRSQSVLNAKQAGPIVDKLLTLTYGRIIDSLPVIGSGSKIIINIGDKGEILGITKHWRELNRSEKKEVRPEEMISVKEAEEMARKQIMTEFGQNVSFEIINSQKSYYDGNGKILQPVWAFNTQINLNDKNLKTVRYLCIIPMLKNSPEPLKLTTIDPYAKEMIKETKVRTDTIPNNLDDRKNND
jgi:hypothetical protein